MLQFVLQKHLKLMFCLAKSLPFIYFVTYQKPRYHILYTVTINNVYLLASNAKGTKCYFCIKTCLKTKCLQNSDFRPCLTWFNTHEENLKPKYKRFWVLLRKIHFHAFFEMSAFGVELMTVNIYTWINKDKCKYRKKS